MIYPEFPGNESVIGICAPSAGVGAKTESFDLSLEVLRHSGYFVYETDSVRTEDYPSAPAWVRGNEFNALYADDDIDMVFCAAGGDYCMEMLPYIDRDLVCSRPKWFAGYSDPTAIEMYLTTVLDIATIYGVNAGSFDWRPLHEYQFNALSILRGDIPVQHSYELYSSMGFDEETGTYVMDAPVDWVMLKGNGTYSQPDEDGDVPEPDLEEIHELDVSGRLIGGCIDVIDWIFGSPYEDFAGFMERYADDGFIWFFDNFELDPMRLMYAMTRMKQAGLFDNARAVIFGRTCFTGEATDIDYLAQLERVFGDMDLPIIWNADIGHTKPSFTIINGAIGRLTFCRGAATLTQKLK